MSDEVYQVNPNRDPKPERSVIISNHIFDDERLTRGLLGIMIYILSKPTKYKLTTTQELIKRFKLNKDTLRKDLNSLEKLGYIRRRKLRNKDGSFGKTLIYISKQGSFGEVINLTSNKSTTRSH